MTETKQTAPPGIEHPLDVEEPKAGLPHPGADGATVPLWKKATAVAAWVVAAFALFVALGNIRGEPESTATGVPLSTVAGPPEAPPPDTLGIRLEEVRERWNSVGRPPEIGAELRRLPEAGELDSFLHRFGGSAELIGAYQDGTGYLVALMVRSDLGRPDVTDLYLHMCQTVDPFSPGCIDDYTTLGLGGLTFDEVASNGTDTTWEHAGSTWRLTIEGGEVTIRVLAPTA